MLDTRHCRATIIKSEACTPAIAAASVRQFVSQVTSFTLLPARVLSTVDSVRLNPSAQEVEIAPDVHRNLKLAIAALEDLEGHRTSATVASARGKLAVHRLRPRQRLHQFERTLDAKEPIVSFCAKTHG